MASQPGEVTQVLIDIRAGKEDAESKLIRLVYDELHRLAAYYLRGERPNHTLQPTALVHEAYLRMANLDEIDWEGRTHFFGTAASVMRHILVDHARAQGANKREGCRQTISLDEAFVVSPSRCIELVALDEALEKLAAIDARGSKIVELRFFGGLSEEEIGAILGISARTVKRDWRVAKAWLFDQINS